MVGSVTDLAGLLAMTNREPNGEIALEQLANAALELTSSRNAMFAILNEESGTLELRNGAGRDWSDEAARETVRVSVNSGEGMIAYVAATGNPLFSNNVNAEPHYRNLFGSQSEIAVPIRDRDGRITAVFNLEADRAENYTEEHLKVAEFVANLASVVLERMDLQRREDALIQIGSSLAGAFSDDELISNVLNIAEDVLRFQALSIFIHERERNAYVLRGSIGSLREQVGTVAYEADEGCTGWVCAQGESLRLAHPQEDPRWKGRFLEFPSEEIASYLAVPIIVRGSSIGAMRAVRRKTDNPYLDNHFTENDMRLLEAIADQLASGLENIRSVERLIRTEQMAAWGELSAKSSHMIGNRVFALRGDVNELGHLLDEGNASPNELKQIQQSLVTNVTRIEEILQDFRDFVTATQLSMVQADINFVVKEAVEEVFPRRSEVQLVYELADDLPTVLVDSRKLRRAISELVENSLNFFDRGKLRVTTAMATPSDIRDGKARIGKRYIAISVEDQGPGVSNEQKALIFQPFFSSRVKGMGLGLSIVKGIVDAHGGVVYEAGRPGEGARFVILLPIPDRPKEEKAS
jgi:signal transduction histidine kinase